MKIQTKGILYALLAASISGVSIWYAKFSVMKTDPLVLTALRNAWAGILFFILLLFSRKKIVFINLIKQLHIKIIIFVLTGSIPFALFFIGLKETGAIQANLIQKTMFIGASIGALLLLKERFSYILMLAYIVILFVVGRSLSFSYSFGTYLIIFATVLWSFEQVFIRFYIRKKINITPLFGFFRMMGGSFVLLFIVFITGKSVAISSLSILQIFHIIIGGTLLFGYVYMWLQALSILPVTTTTFILTLSVPIGTFLQYSLLGYNSVVISDIIFSIGIIGIVPLALYLLRLIRKYETLL